jgi:hypothetical protein
LHHKTDSIPNHQFCQLLHKNVWLYLSYLTALSVMYDVLILLQKQEKQHWQWLGLKSEQWIKFKRNSYEVFCSLLVRWYFTNAHGTERDPLERNITGYFVSVVNTSMSQTRAVRSGEVFWPFD